MADELRTLFLIFKDKDEMFSNQLRKLVATKDDNTEIKEVIGTEDGSVNVVAWNEKQWLNQKGTVDTSEKVLFLGDVKGTDKLIPVIDEKYNQYGIHYGWAGNQAIIYVEKNSLKKREDYDRFLSEMRQKTDVKTMQKDKKIDLILKRILRVKLLIPFFALFHLAEVIKDVFEDKDLVRNQQYFLGIFEMYMNHLEIFMKY